MLSDEDKARIEAEEPRPALPLRGARVHGAARLDSQEYIVINEDGAPNTKLWNDPNFQAGLA